MNETGFSSAQFGTSGMSAHTMTRRPKAPARQGLCSLPPHLSRASLPILKYLMVCAGRRPVILRVQEERGVGSCECGWLNPLGVDIFRPTPIRIETFTFKVYPLVPSPVPICDVTLISSSSSDSQNTSSTRSEGLSEEKSAVSGRRESGPGLTEGLSVHWRRALAGRRAKVSCWQAVCCCFTLSICLLVAGN